MSSAVEVVALIDRALELCNFARSRRAPNMSSTFDSIRGELEDWKSSVHSAWPPDPELVHRTRTLGVYAARDLLDYEPELATAIAAARAAIKREQD